METIEGFKCPLCEEVDYWTVGKRGLSAMKYKPKPDCEHYIPFGGMQDYAMETMANYCAPYMPWSCERTQKEGVE